ncbi:MAG: hypothetical protein HYZ62_01460 [Candidatus Andersenbacteria bacterium]|nr:hypothetical protein [Candidatus Andersenbacteria bacterium]
MTYKGPIKTFILHTSVAAIIAACLLISIFPEDKYWVRILYATGIIIFLATVGRPKQHLNLLPVLIVPILAVLINTRLPWYPQLGIIHLGATIILWSFLYVAATAVLQKAELKMMASKEAQQPAAPQ